MGSIKDKYTTKTLKIIDPLGEKNKIELSDDAYAVCTLLETIVNKGLR